MVPKLTKEQAAIIGAYTGFTAGPFSDLQAYAGKFYGEGISTVGMLEVADDLKKKAKADFLAICAD